MRFTLRCFHDNGTVYNIKNGIYVCGPEVLEISLVRTSPLPPTDSAEVGMRSPTHVIHSNTHLYVHLAITSRSTFYAANCTFACF